MFGRRKAHTRDHIVIDMTRDPREILGKVRAIEAFLSTHQGQTHRVSVVIDAKRTQILACTCGMPRSEATSGDAPAVLKEEDLFDG